MAACVELTHRRVQIEALSGKEQIAERAKWLVDLRAHEHEFHEELQAQDEHLAAAASVSGMASSTWIAMYRHYSDTEVSMFKARSKSFVQASVKQILGSDVEPEDLSSWFKGMSPEDVDRVLAAQVRSRDEFAPFDQQWRTWHVDRGEWRIVRATSRAVWDEDPFLPAYFEGVIMDVTEHVNAAKNFPQRRSTSEKSRREFAEAMKNVWANLDELDN